MLILNPMDKEGFQSERLTRLEYGVLVFLDTAYWILFPSWSSVKCRHRYTVSSLMDTAYWLSEQINDAIKVTLFDVINIQSKNSANDGRNTRRLYVQEEVIESNNVQNDVGNIQRTLQTTSLGTVENAQCYNCSEKGHYARNSPKPRIRDSKYFMKQMLLAKHDATGVILTDEQNDFLFVDASRMKEIKELNANICLMARNQSTNIDSDVRPSYDSAFHSEVQTPSTSYVNPLFAKDNQEQKYPTQAKIINKSIGDDQIDSNIIFDKPNEDVNSGSVEYDNGRLDSHRKYI
ncbi:integrase, catalytic region, zinc finger, CCHC-type containing protein [Tanacetum coccineum]